MGSAEDQPDIFGEELLAFVERMDREALRRGLAERPVRGNGVLEMIWTVRLWTKSGSHREMTTAR